MKKIYDNSYPSVTGVIDVLRKKGLEFYFKANLPEWLEAESKKNLSIGSTIHSLIQSHIEKEKIEIETEYLDEVKTALKSFFLFKKDFPQIKLKKAEISLTSEKWKYNGTCDCTGTEGTELLLVDWKTSKCDVGTKKEKEVPVIYPEHMYQAAAYVVAYNEQMKTNIERARIIAIAKDKICYNTIILLKKSMDEMFNEVFLPALRILSYQTKQKEGY